MSSPGSNHEILIHKGESPSDVLMIIFSGYNDENRGPQRPFDFHNFLEKHFPTIDKVYLKDDKRHMYHHGPVGDSVETMTRFLQDHIVGYKTVLVTGVSSGGYAAVLYGSLLDSSAIHVLAFIPQTIISAKGMEEGRLDARYADLLPHLSGSTHYYIYGDSLRQQETHVHSIHHCERISSRPNVRLMKKRGVYLKRLRDSGELLEIFLMVLTNGRGGVNS